MTSFKLLPNFFWTNRTRRRTCDATQPLVADKNIVYDVLTRKKYNWIVVKIKSYIEISKVNMNVPEPDYYSGMNNISGQSIFVAINTYTSHTLLLLA